MDMQRKTLTSLLAVAAVSLQLKADEPPMPPSVAAGAKLEVAYDETETAKRFFEGPSYDPKSDSLYFTAFSKDGSQILRLDSAGKVSVFLDSSDGVNGTFLSRRGGLLGCQGGKSRVVRIALDGSPGEIEVVADNCDGKKFGVPNDIAEDARGGFYFTDPDFKEKKASVVYYVAPDGKVRPAVTDMQVPNGVYVGKGGKVLYVSDSAALNVRAYPINPFTGEADQKQGRVFFEPQTENKNAPDGMTMDERGNMYFTGRGGVWVVDPAGKPLGLIAIAEFCSNSTFGGRNGRTLFMTCQNRVYKLAMNVSGWEHASRHQFTGNEPLQFKKIVLDTTFRSEGVAVADVNKDGKLDVLASDVWYEAPDWKMHEIRPPAPYDGTKGYSRGFGSWTDDWNGDGYPDVIVIPFPGEPAHWYENPKGQHTGSDGKPVHWREHLLWHSACNETPTYADLFGPGKKALLMAWQPPGKENEGVMAYFLPPKNGQGMWQESAISGLRAPYTFRFSHGLGVGDVNGDGRNDAITPAGWWEQPADRPDREWPFHPAPLSGGEAAAVADMFAYDVSGDGLNDIISSSAHRYGIWWFEQLRSASGETEWRQHLIDDSFSQTHATHLVDLNGDGVKDIITGSRYYAHQGHDPGEQDAIVLYWFEIKRRAGAVPEFVKHLIALDVGIGTQFVVQDTNGDGRLDIVVANKKGVHMLEQQQRGVRSQASGVSKP
jgi:sugar lactone lactonase YvrE